MIGSVVPLFLAAALAQAPGQSGGALEPVFQQYPFERWLTEREQAAIRWTAAVGAPKLSFHQRLVMTVDVKVDGRDLQERREGQLIYFVQITDATGARYQNHGSIDLDKVENAKSIDLQYLPSAFILPGEYQLAAAILDTATGEHSVRQSRFRVAPPKLAFLTEEWRNLPAVEFLGNEEPPDLWYLPKISGRLQWATAVRSPARLSIVLNIVAPPPHTTARQGESVEFSALIPTLRAMSETGAPSIAERIDVLDLGRHKSVFNQNGGELDWSRLKITVGQSNTASIDIHSLSGRNRDAQFFVGQIRKIVTAAEQQPCALVVLTPPVAFESGADLEPISLEGLPACRVFYVRYRAPPPVRPLGADLGGTRPGRRPFGGRGGPMQPPHGSQFVVDQLEQTLKPLNPKVFDVETPDQMTRVFMEIEKALATGGQGR